MANQIITRVIPRTLTPFFSRSLSTTTTPSSSIPSFLRRLRPLATAAVTSRHILLPSFRALSTCPTTSSLNDQNPNWPNLRPVIDGCDFEHWLVVMKKPDGDPSRDEIIDGYIKTFAEVIGNEEEARKNIYSVSTRHYFAFGALCSEELSYKLKELPKVREVLPDSYLNVEEKDYGGEPFINGQAVPYDPKYHEVWVRNNAGANERRIRRIRIHCSKLRRIRSSKSSWIRLSKSRRISSSKSSWIRLSKSRRISSSKSSWIRFSKCRMGK